MIDLASTTRNLTATLAQWDVGFRAAEAAWLLPLGLVVVVGLTVWLYRGTSLQRRWRWALAIVRGLVLAAVLAMLFQPVLAVQAASRVSQHVLVLLDVSQSMALADERQAPADVAEARLALGEQANAHAETQARIARLWRPLRRAEQALAARQWTELFDALATWRDRLDELEQATPDDDTLREAVAPWRERADQLRDRLDRWTRQAEPTAEQQGALSEALVGLREQVDAQLDERADAARRDAAGELATSTMPTRLELARGLLSDESAGVLDALERDYTVRYFTFGDALRSPGDGAAQDQNDPRAALLETEAGDASTQLGAAIDEVVARHAGRPIAGVVVLSDGAANRGLDPLSVADRLGERGIGVYPVGVGLPKPPDVAIEQMIAPPVSFVRDQVPLRVQVRSAGFVGRSVNVTATLDGRVVAEQALSLTRDPQWVELPFEVDQPTESAELSVSVSTLEGEVSEANNRQAQDLRVIDEKIRVLYVEGKPRWEFRYLRQVLLRDHRLRLHLLMTEGDRGLANVSDVHLARLPSDPEALFEYDLVILGDVPADYFRADQLEMLDALVRERGGALAMIAGERHAPGSYAGTALERALPVRINGRRPVTVSDAGRWRITDAGRRSAMTRLVPERSDNERVWQLVHPMLRLPDLAGAKPGATVLAELEGDQLGADDQPYPLLSWQRYGSGRTLFLASDQLWRLRFRRGDQHHARFWGQAIQFLTLARVMGEANRVQIATDAERYSTGQSVRVTANVLGEGYEPLNADTYTLALEPRDGAGEPRTLELEAMAGAAGLFQAQFAVEPGAYRITDPADPEASVPASFRVTRQPPELTEPAMDEALLRQLARRSGGRYLTAGDWPALQPLFPPDPPPVLVRRERDLWSQPWLLVVLVGLLGGEWFIRRKMQQL